MSRTFLLLWILLVAGIVGIWAMNQPAADTRPTQVVYRFDDHRYLELKGWDCEGELWYIDRKRGIRTNPVSQFYRIYTKKYVHPSERYIALPTWDSAGFILSKDYGQTWYPSTFSPGENEPNGDSSPPYDDILSFTVVNDQGFLLTKHRLYMSSKPYEDPRLAAGGPGVTYRLKDGTVQKIEPRSPGWPWGMVYRTKQALVRSIEQYKINWQEQPDEVPQVNGTVQKIEPRSPGWPWGMVYRTKQALVRSIEQYKINWQEQPDEVPQVKDYSGWNQMRCDMDAGRKP